jgi:hypothetical protein
MRTDSSPSTRTISNGSGEAAHQGLSQRRNDPAAAPACCPCGRVLCRSGQPGLATSGVTGGCRRRGAPGAAREVTQFPGGDLDSAAGLPGPAHAPAPVSNTVQPLRSPLQARHKQPTRQQDHRNWADIDRQVSSTTARIVTGGLAVAPLPLWCSVTGAAAGDTGSGPRRGIYQLSWVVAFGAAWIPSLTTDWGWA